jgi:outer membrane protein assembly factor BamB
MFRFAKLISSPIAMLVAIGSAGCTTWCQAQETATGTEVATSIASAASSDTNQWLQWRGPNRDAQFHGGAWPNQLTGQLEQVWRVELGPSYSGPIVNDRLVFTTETKDKKTEVVHALDRATGKEVWQKEWEGAMKVPFFARSNGSWIRATPACDGQTLYVAGIRDVLVALDVETGAEKWRVDFVEQLGTELPSFGFVSSPLVVGGHIFVQAGGCFIKLDKTNGHIVWQSAEDGGGMYGSAFSSPAIATIHGETMLLVQTRNELKGIALDDGRELWSREIEAFRGMNILTPTLFEEGVFTSAHSGRSLLLSFKKEGDEYAVTEAWQHKAQAYMSTPVVIGDYAYMHLKNQRFTCLNLKTGEEAWRSTGYGKYASLVANGDKILALDERGELLLMKADPTKFELLDTLQISDDPTWAHLAVVDGHLFVRELNALTAYKWK